MIKFIDYVKSLFPNIDPYIESETKKALLQFKETGKTCGFSTTNVFNYLAQGDIIENLPFVRTDATGKIRNTRCKGMILSNTCSCENDDYIMIAPLIELSKFKNEGLISNIRDNLNYRYMFLPDYEEYIVDFRLANAINKHSVLEHIKKGNLKKIRSLNVLGFYLLIAKLTVCFVRPENAEVQEERYDEYSISLE